MGNNENLISAIKQLIKNNNNQEITGDLLQNTLLNIVSSISYGALYCGMVDSSFIPSTPDPNAFYIANKPGVYNNFGNFVVNNGELAIFHNVQPGGWHMNKFNMTESVQKEYDDLSEKISNDNLYKNVLLPKNGLFLSGGRLSYSGFTDGDSYWVQDIFKLLPEKNKILKGVFVEAAPVLETSTVSIVAINKNTKSINVLASKDISAHDLYYIGFNEAYTVDENTLIGVKCTINQTKFRYISNNNDFGVTEYEFKNSSFYTTIPYSGMYLNITYVLKPDA